MRKMFAAMTPSAGKIARSDARTQQAVNAAPAANAAVPAYTASNNEPQSPLRAKGEIDNAADRNAMAVKT
ncbi:MAG: hypothetical protein ACT4P3_22275 [Betaproteobacteria bacterium]